MRVFKCRRCVTTSLGLAALALFASSAHGRGALPNDETTTTAENNNDSASLSNYAEGPAASAPAPAPAPAAAPQAAAARSEVPGVTYGFYERFRFEGYNNADFNDAKHDRLNQARIRLRPYTDINFGQYFEGYLRLGWEGVKRYSDASFPAAPNGGEQTSPFTAGEVWFDSAYLTLKKVPGVPNLSMQAGRFEISKGDGFLFSDPSGVDGSRTNYDNAFDMTYKMGRSKFELIGIYNPKYDDFFPLWNKQPIVDPSGNACNNGTIKNYIPALAQTGKQLSEWDQSAIGVYYTNRDMRNTDIDAYTFFNKSYGDLRKQSYYEYLPDRHYTLFGGRAVHRIQKVKGLSVTGEFAYEAGTEDSQKAGVSNFDLRAWGGYGYAKQRFNVKFNPYITAGFWALSGQDPNSRTVGNFDPLFSRSTNMSIYGDAPSWSEFYVYSQGYEEGSYYWTNLEMAQVESGFSPIKRVTLVGGYAHLDAMHPFAVNPYHAAGSVVPATATSGVFGTGTDRGDLAKARVVCKITPSLQAYVNLEKMLPGDYYIPQNSGYWFRSEITYRFSGFLPIHK